MEFDDHDEGDEEIGLPVGSRGESVAATAGVALEGSGHRKAHGGGGVRYRECLKNHAVGIGGHAVDGCREFMAAGEEGTLDALRCAACGCHRNFHRKDSGGSGAGGGAAGGGGALEVTGYHPQFSPYYRTLTGYLHHPPYQPATFAQEDHEDVSNPTMGGGGGGTRASGSGVRKRFRTKFTQEQKEKLLAFAERLGWRIQKHDEAAVQQFCEETCIKRHVLKVWMHNNKHTLGKKP
ncbi:ZF-HD homeobox protein [Musa troglodytarum]|uniref:ZF-HD homeobox protein n=1 Tax=Musa troglodytarum TaxID=320322 RepID=A0A9E7EDB7_9LILI|nr:ZF-HD homeobox protein [Musa troglodytarum]